MQGLGVPITHARGTSWLHGLNPIAKLTWVAAVVVVAFAVYHPGPLLAIAIVGLGLSVSAGIGRALVRVLVVLAPVTASMIVIQTLAPATCQGPCTAAAELGPLTLYREGMSHSLSLVSRVLAMEIVALGVLISTHPSDLFAAFARLRMPYTLNFMLSMTLQLIPVLQREVSIVLSAQRSRGMRSTGFGSIIPSFVPVFVGAFERVQQLSISLESRGFGSSVRRTSYRRVRFDRVDAIVVGLGLAAAVVGLVGGLTMWNADGTPTLVLPPAVTLAVFLLAAAMFLGVILVGIRSIARA